VRNYDIIGVCAIDSFTSGVKTTVHDGTIGPMLYDDAGSSTVNGAVDDGGGICCCKNACMVLVASRVADTEIL